AAATPTIKLAVEMMPSLAPSTAARNQPMRLMRGLSGCRRRRVMSHSVNPLRVGTVASAASTAPVPVKMVICILLCSAVRAADSLPPATLRPDLLRPSGLLTPLTSSPEIFVSDDRFNYSDCRPKVPARRIAVDANGRRRHEISLFDCSHYRKRQISALGH